jgi:hypothetical protein
MDLPCAGKTELFFATDRRLIAQAKSICDTCNLRTPCRALGRERLEHGVWGGESSEERAQAGFVPARDPRVSRYMASPAKRLLAAVAVAAAVAAGCGDIRTGAPKHTPSTSTVAPPAAAAAVRCDSGDGFQFGTSPEYARERGWACEVER